MKQTLLAFFLGATIWSNAQSVNIIPQPASVKVSDGSFTITPSTKLVLEASNTEKSAAFLNSYLKKFYGFQLKIFKGSAYPENAVILNFDKLENPLPGAYEMKVDKNKIYIGGDNEEGVFYAIQSLIQLLPTEKSTSLTIQQCSISDAPRFAYRGMMLDCGRHFFSVDFVKQYIDFLAMAKMNTFHWHLTEDN